METVENMYPTFSLTSVHVWTILPSCIPMKAESPIHGSAMLMMNAGNLLFGHPSLGSWVNYGLGSVNENLPGYVVMLDKTGGPISGAKNWSSGYMPASFQGTVLRSQGSPILDLENSHGIPRSQQRTMLDHLRTINEGHLSERYDNTNLSARVASYELAYKMQASAPEAVDVDSEPEYVKNLYGMDGTNTEDFGRKCLLARRLVERGVRFIQIYSGGHHNDNNWDAHGDLVKNHSYHAGNTDKPIAGLLKDLKQRGLLDETLVVWGGEFGRQPTAEYKEGLVETITPMGLPCGWRVEASREVSVSVRRMNLARLKQTAFMSSDYMQQS